MKMMMVLNVDGNSDKYRLFCVEGDEAKGVDLSGSQMTLNYGVGGSLRLSTSPSGTSGDWTFFNLLGRTVSWTVDLSHVPCGLNATFYAVSLTQKDGYHDACATFFTTTEVDFMEANQYAWHTTLHRGSHDCGSAPPIGIGGTISDPRYLLHDLNGTENNSHSLYGPGDTYTIDTRFPFQASLALGLDDKDHLEKVVLCLSQGTHAIGQQWDATNEEYKGWLEALGNELVVGGSVKGNVLVWSVWTGGLNWLESPPCPGGSNARCSATSCQYTISDISITL
jgi:Glycosyl hydrolase family 7